MRRTEAHSGFHEAHSGLHEAHSGYMRRKSESIELLELRAQNLKPLVHSGLHEAHSGYMRRKSESIELLELWAQNLVVPFIRLNLKLFKKV